MNEHDATEAAYKNGYKHGMADAVKALCAAADTMAKTLNLLWTTVKHGYEIYEHYPNKRVKHLALYAKKQRIRKKNMRRIGREALKKIQGGELNAGKGKHHSHR